MYPRHYLDLGDLYNMVTHLTDIYRPLYITGGIYKPLTNKQAIVIIKFSKTVGKFQQLWNHVYTLKLNVK